MKHIKSIAIFFLALTGLGLWGRPGGKEANPKLLSSIPLFNKVFLAPLMVINSFTTSLCWSFTEEGTEGGYAAWVECLGLPRKPGALPHAKIPFYMRYGPNWRSFGTLYWKPRPAPPKPPEGPPPKSPSPPPPKSVEPPPPPPR